MTDLRARARQIAVEEGIHPDLFERLVGAESSFNPGARSSAGAIGLAQLMPGTARDLGVDPNDPEQNLRGGARYLKQMQDKFRSTPMALAAYNAGPGRVSRAGGVPNIPETEAYVAKINAQDDDSDIFGDTPAAPTAAAEPAQPSIRRGADGTIEIDINKGATPAYGEDSDIFADTASPDPATDAALPATPPENPALADARKTVAGIDHLPEPFRKMAQQNMSRARGAMFGLADEGAGAVSAGATGLRNLLLDAQGKEAPYGMGDAYKAGRQAMNEQADAYHKAAPVDDVVNQAAGGAWLPVGKVIGASRGLPLIAKSLGLGAGVGAVAGGAGAEPGSRGQGAVAGGFFGGATGAALPPALGVLGRAAGAVGRTPLAQRLANLLEGHAGDAPRPAAPTRADIRVAEALERAATRDEGSLADVAARARETPSVPAFQAGGENMLALTEVAAQSPGKASTILTDAVRNDKTAASHRVKDEIGKGLGGTGDYFATMDKIIAKRSNDASAGIKAIEQSPVALDQSAVVALRSDLAKTAIRDAAQNALASPDEAVRNSGAQLARLADEVLDQPGNVQITVRGAQDISKSLLDAADAAFKGGNGARGKALKELGRAVRDNARDPAKGGVKEYGDWLKAYGDESDHIAALELGRDILSGKHDMSAERLRKVVGEMSLTSLDNFRKGVGEAILNEARTKGSINAMRQALKEEIGDRVHIAFPDEAGYKSFMNAAETEVLREAKNNRVLNNSRTFGRGAAAEDLKAQGVDAADVASAAADLFSLNIGSVSGKALKAALKNLPRKDRSILGDPVTNEVLGRALKDPDEMTRLLNQLEALKARQARRPNAMPAIAAPAASYSATKAEKALN